MDKNNFNPDKYPLSEGDNRHFYFVRTAVNHEGKWYSANIVKGGYNINFLLPVKDEEEAIKFSNVHNDYVGFSKEYVDKCIAWSIKTCNEAK